MKTFEVCDGGGFVTHEIKADLFNWQVNACGPDAIFMVALKGRGSIDRKTKQRRFAPVAVFHAPAWVKEKTT